MKHIFSLIISAALIVSGFGQTRNVLVGTNNAVVQPTNFWSADATNARTGLGLGSAATNPASAFQPSSATLSNLASNNAVNLTNLRATNIVGVIPSSNIPTVSLTNISGTLAITQGGTGATNAGGARTNLGLGETNSVTFSNIIVGSLSGVAGGFVGFDTGGQLTLRGTNLTASVPAFFGYDGFNVTAMSPSSARFRLEFSTNLDSLWTATNASNARSSVGLDWPALTNTNSGTGLVSVNTNGEVVSPTNFWQVAPINTRVQLSQPVVNATNAATNARNLYLYSLSISTTGVTNTITLPTNSLVFLGDVATVIHDGPTSSVTAIRQIGSATNLITLNQVREAVKFIYESDGWRLADNISYVEPIQFSGTNAAANAAASRTNLGLGATWLTNTNVTNFRTSVGLGETNIVTFDGVIASDSIFTPDLVGDNITVEGAIYFTEALTNAGATRANLGLGQFKDAIGDNWAELYDNGELRLQAGNTIVFYESFDFGGTNFAIYASNSRTALGIPLAALTNTNNANFRSAIELGATNNVTFSNVTASGTLTATSTVTAKTNLVVEGFVDYTEARTNNSPTNAGNFGNHARWIEVKIGTNSFFLPAYQ